MSLPVHTFSLHLLYHRMSPPQNLTLQPLAFFKTLLLQLFFFHQNLQFFLPSIFLLCYFYFLSLYWHPLISFYLKEKKCLFHLTLPFSSYNNITSHSSVLHAMTSWLLCAPLPLISLAAFFLFPSTEIEFCKFIKDLFLLSQSSTFSL